LGEKKNKNFWSKFSSDFFRNAKAAKENTVVSPLSIVSALYMLASGSAGNAKTEIEAALNVTGNENYIEDYSYLLSALKNNPISDFEEDENAQYTLEICNGAFYQTKFQDGDVAVFAEVKKINPLSPK